jgi:hypothetical protein
MLEASGPTSTRRLRAVVVVVTMAVVSVAVLGALAGRAD